MGLACSVVCLRSTMCSCSPPASEATHLFKPIALIPRPVPQTGPCVCRSVILIPSRLLDWKVQINFTNPRSTLSLCIALDPFYGPRPQSLERGLVMERNRVGFKGYRGLYWPLQNGGAGGRVRYWLGRKNQKTRNIVAWKTALAQQLRQTSFHGTWLYIWGAAKKSIFKS